MKISSCSRALPWPTYSSSIFGRSARSSASSCGDVLAAVTTRGRGAKSSVWMAMLRLSRPTIRPVFVLRRQLRRFAWIALTAMLALALMPTLSHAFSFARGAQSALSEVCTPQGARVVALNDQAPEPAPAAFGHLDHCPLCSLHGAALGMPPATPG